jgi:hypothetical protein
MKPWRGVHTTCGKTVAPRLNDLQQGVGCCRDCGIEARAEKRRLTNADARRRAQKYAPDFKPTEDYPGATEPWRGVHTSCGKAVAPRLANLQRGSGCCIDCGHEVTTENRRLTDAEARRNAKDYSPDFEPMEEYPGSVDAPWRGTHTRCGNAVTTRLHSLRQGRGCCRNCGIEACADKQRLTDGEARRRTKEYSPDFEPTGDYPGAMKPWRGVHTKCGNAVAPRFNDLQQGIGCCRDCGIELAADKKPSYRWRSAA